jgi:hypothetical protein
MLKHHTSDAILTLWGYLGPPNNYIRPRGPRGLRRFDIERSTALAKMKSLRMHAMLA